MKKLVSICLVLVLAIGLLTVPAYAQDTEVLPADLQIQSGEDALELACQIWPEYEDKLMWKDTVPLARNAVAATNEVVIEKTHHLSENESLHMSNIRMVLQRYFLIRTGSKTAILPVLDTMNIMAVFLLQVA